jgi:hypothetical protein
VSKKTVAGPAAKVVRALAQECGMGSKLWAKAQTTFQCVRLQKKLKPLWNKETLELISTTHDAARIHAVVEFDHSILW